MGGKNEHQKPMDVKKEVLRSLEIQARKWDRWKKMFTIVVLGSIALIIPSIGRFIEISLLAMIFYELKGM